MLRRFCLIIAAAVLISGCTATPQPKIKFPADTRIGVINRLEGYAAQQSFSSLRIGSFSKKLNKYLNIIFLKHRYRHRNQRRAQFQGLDNASTLLKKLAVLKKRNGMHDSNDNGGAELHLHSAGGST